MTLGSGGQARAAICTVPSGQRLPSLCLSASPRSPGDAIHLFWVVLGFLFTLPETAEGSGVLPTKLCRPLCLLGEPWPSPGPESGQVVQVTTEQQVLWVLGPHGHGSATPSPISSLRLGLWLVVVVSGEVGSEEPGQEATVSQPRLPCPAQRSGSGPHLFFCFASWWPGDVQASACPS